MFADANSFNNLNMHLLSTLEKLLFILIRKQEDHLLELVPLITLLHITVNLTFSLVLMAIKCTSSDPHINAYLQGSTVDLCNVSGDISSLLNVIWVDLVSVRVT